MITPHVSAQQLPVRHYDVADGLPSGSIRVIHQDRKGYLWFGTQEGLSRFDGYKFSNYDERDGLGHSIVNAIVEDGHGDLWVATNGGGIARLRSRTEQESHAGRSFRNFRVADSQESNQVDALVFDTSGTLWCATDDGIYRSTRPSAGDVRFELVHRNREANSRMAVFADRFGRMWFGLRDELIEVADNQIIRHKVSRYANTEIMAIVEDGQGRLLVANERALFRFSESDDHNPTWEELPVRLRPGQLIRCLLKDEHHGLWLGTTDGLIKFQDNRQSLYTSANGLSNDIILSLAKDSDGNLWVGTWNGGTCKLSDELISNVTHVGGVPIHATGIVEDSRGRLYASLVAGGIVEIVGGRAVTVPGSKASPFNRAPRLFQDSRGNWWISTANGLFQSDGPDLQLRRARRLGGSAIVPRPPYPMVTEGPSGTLWVTDVEGVYQLDLRNRAHNLFQPVPTTTLRGAVAQLSDRAGALWIGGHHLLVRLLNGKTTVFEPGQGLPETDSRSFFQDSQGYLWIGLRNGGLSMTRNPDDEHPQFINYSTSNGLLRNHVWAVTEDDAGRIYFSTGTSLDQLDPLTEFVRHFNARDGLASDTTGFCLKDRSGNIWVATSQGLSKLNPRVERAANKPPVYLTRVQIAGEQLKLSESGELNVPEFNVRASSNNLLIEYVGLSFQGEQRLRYQYRLEGADRDWSEPGSSQSVNYARLEPGRYRFEVRAVSQDGVTSAEPAVLHFRILPPIWRRWWFVTLVIATLAAAGYALYRYRVARLLELERVRTRIATDLHDDIGAGLSRVAILSEVVKRQVGGAGEQPISMLTEIADSARGLVESMREMVWAIDPSHDNLEEVVSRIRQFGSDVLEAQGINWEFKVAPGLEQIKLDPEQRRHLLLFFKEAINNAVKHAACHNVSLTLKLAREQLLGEVHDDGHGFVVPPAETVTGNGKPSRNGHGLNNMRRRAVDIGGRAEIDSSPGEGACVRITVPLKR